MQKGEVSEYRKTEQTDQYFQALSKLAINIVDLIDARRTGEPLQIFQSKAELRAYSRATGKIFSKKKAKSDGYLKVLLIQMF